MPTSTPSLTQLQRALAIAEQIQTLEEELAAVLGHGGEPPAAPAKATAAPKPGKPGRKPFSAETRAKMAAAQQARWTARKSASAGAIATAKPVGKTKGKRTVSPEVRARLAAAMKARWASAKKKGVPGPNARK